MVERLERVGRYLLLYQCLSQERRWPLEPTMVQYRRVRELLLRKYWHDRRAGWEEYMEEEDFYRPHGRPHWDTARHWTTNGGQQQN